MNDLNLSRESVKAVSEMGFTEWTEIQERTIPLILQGRDVIAQSFTGSGKTAAFGLPILDKTAHDRTKQALIIAPTRELCEQITKELHKFSKYNKKNILSVYGGVSIEPQINGSKTAEIIVGTPGRMLDLIDRRTMDLSGIKYLVLDEADRMLDMGFIDDVRKILSFTPRNRQTMLFSATIPNEIKDIVRRFMNNPQNVKVQEYVDESLLVQKYYSLESSDKLSLLVHILKTEKPAITMIFCATRHMVDLLTRNLRFNDIKAESLHGGLTQNRRDSVMRGFHEKKYNVLVASDVAARGIDIKDIDLVVNYDIPKNSKDYIHRIGRTARAGSSGAVISFVTRPDYENFRSVLSDRSLTIEKTPTPQFYKVKMAPSQRPEFSREHPRFGPSRRGFSHRGFHGQSNTRR